MTYQIALLQSIKVEEITLDTFSQLVSHVEKEHYHHMRTGRTGQMLEIKQYNDGQLIYEKIISVGYTDYTETILAEFEVKSQTVVNRFKKRLRQLFNRLKQKGRKHKMTDGNKVWEEKKSTELPLTPDQERARIAATVAATPTEKSDINYGQAYQEAQQPQSSSVVSHTPTDEEVEAEAEAVFGIPATQQKSVQSTPVETTPAVPQAPNLLDLVNQEKLLKHLAVIADEQAQIRQKILDNQAIIDQAKRLEIENENLELEYQAQENTFKKLQQFNALFEELREYLQ